MLTSQGNCLMICNFTCFCILLILIPMLVLQDGEIGCFGQRNSIYKQGHLEMAKNNFNKEHPLGMHPPMPLKGLQLYI